MAQPFARRLAGGVNEERCLCRSEELYRAYLVLQACPRARLGLDALEVVVLYTQTVPARLWPRLTAHFDGDFRSALKDVALERARSPRDDFDCIWSQYAEAAKCSDVGWLEDKPPLVDRLCWILGFLRTEPPRRESCSARLAGGAQQVGGRGAPHRRAPREPTGPWLVRLLEVDEAFFRVGDEDMLWLLRSQSDIWESEDRVYRSSAGNSGWQ